MRTLCTKVCSHARVVREVENELEEQFKSAGVPEPKESAQYIIAHALGYKTVSLCVVKSIMQSKLCVCLVCMYWWENILCKVPSLVNLNLNRI